MPKKTVTTTLPHLSNEPTLTDAPTLADVASVSKPVTVLPSIVDELNALARAESLNAENATIADYPQDSSSSDDELHDSDSDEFVDDFGELRGIEGLQLNPDFMEEWMHPILQNNPDPGEENEQTATFDEENYFAEPMQTFMFAYAPEQVQNMFFRKHATCLTISPPTMVYILPIIHEENRDLFGIRKEFERYSDDDNGHVIYMY